MKQLLDKVSKELERATTRFERAAKIMDDNKPSTTGVWKSTKKEMDLFLKASKDYDKYSKIIGILNCTQRELKSYIEQWEN